MAAAFGAPALGILLATS